MGPAEGTLDKEARLTGCVARNKILNWLELRFFIYPEASKTFIKPILFKAVEPKIGKKKQTNQKNNKKEAIPVNFCSCEIWAARNVSAGIFCQ